MAHGALNLTPVQNLALTYANSDVKAPFALLMAFDSRLADVVLTSSEPMIAQLKLAWWRDALSAARDKRPKGEPMLALLSEIESAERVKGVPSDMLSLVDAWEILSVQEDAQLEHFSDHRGDAVFKSFARWNGAAVTQDIEMAGRRWSLADMMARTGRSDISVSPQPVRLSRPLRPLTILERGAVGELQSGRQGAGFSLLWHALTGL